VRIAAHCITVVLLKMLQLREWFGLINSDHLFFTHCVPDLHGKIQSRSFETIHFISTTENYWLISTALFWIYSNETKRKLELAYP